MDYEPLVEFADDQEPAQVLEESIPYEQPKNLAFSRNRLDQMEPCKR